jgi:hypothetical protein
LGKIGRAGIRRRREKAEEAGAAAAARSSDITAAAAALDGAMVAIADAVVVTGLVREGVGVGWVGGG